MEIMVAIPIILTIIILELLLQDQFASVEIGILTIKVVPDRHANLVMFVVIVSNEVMV